MFADETEIRVASGKGGDGCVAFRREKYIPRGGPAGGDGGRGGDVVLVADPSITTLLDLQRRVEFGAPHGHPGEGACRTGASGKDLEVRVPLGTVVTGPSGQVLADLTRPGQRVVVARGGEGGWGNRRFATATHRTPREATPGGPSEERTLRLTLRLMADAGLVGLPNAGKSTLLRRLSAATPRVADYPYTTLAPYLGVVELAGERRFVLADLPGLIEGAHQGVGLGDRFLRHLERTRVLVHLVDAAPLDGSDPVEAYRTVRRELEAYGQGLEARPEIVVASKLDLTGSREGRQALGRALGVRVLGLSAVSGEGLREVAEAVAGAVYSGGGGS